MTDMTKKTLIPLQPDNGSRLNTEENTKYGMLHITKLQTIRHAQHWNFFSCKFLSTDKAEFKRSSFP